MTRTITPWTFLLIIASLFAVLFVRSLMPNGVGVSIDSVNYIAAMRSFLAGHDFLHWSGTPLTHWPPLFAASMAPIGWLTAVLNQDFMKAMALVNALVFGATVFLAGRFFLEHLRHKSLAVIGALALVNFPMVHVLVYAFAEPLFNLLVLLFTIALTQLARTQQTRWIFVLVIVAGLAGLQRYVGVFLVPTGALAFLVLLRRSSIWRRVSYAIAYSIFAGLPVAMLMLRNYLAVGAISADFPPPQRLVLDDMKLGAQNLVGWFTTVHFERVPVSQEVSALIVAVFALLVFALAINLWRRASLNTALLPVVIVLAGYFGGLIALALRYDFDPPTNRFLSPIYIHVMFLATFVLDAALQWFEEKASRQIYLHIAGTTVIGIAIVWLVCFPLNRAANELYRVLSPSCCLDAEWFNSPVNEWLRSHPLESTVVSNTPIPLYYSGTHAIMTPVSVGEWLNPTVSSTYDYLIWLNDDHYNDSTYSLGELSSVIELVPIVEFSDGGVYSIGALRGSG